MPNNTSALDFDLGPGAGSDGSDLLRHAYQLVPRVTTRVHDGVVVLPNAVTEKVGPEKLLHILDGIQFWRIAWKREQADVVGDGQFRRCVPTGTVQHEHRMRAYRNPPTRGGSAMPQTCRREAAHPSAAVRTLQLVPAWSMLARCSRSRSRSTSPHSGCKPARRQRVSSSLRRMSARNEQNTWPRMAA